MSEKKSEYPPEGEKLAVTQYKLHSVTLILQLRTRDAVNRSLDYKNSKKRLVEAIGQHDADAIEEELFESEGSLLSLPPPPPDEE